MIIDALLKKKNLFFLLLVSILGLWVVKNYEKPVIILEGNDQGGIYASLTYNNTTDIVQPYYSSKDKQYYFFLPSYVKNARIGISRFLECDKAIDIHDNSVYTITFNSKEYDVVFMHSDNMSTLYLDSQSGGFDYIQERKGNEESGAVKLVNADGGLEYQGKVDKITGRGNSTWTLPKKSYNITLDKSYPLCGMDAGKKWVLVSLWNEDTKMNNMLALQLAQCMGLEYTPKAVWVDLYCGGQYMGLYLLTEAVSCDKGRVELENRDGAFLIEKELIERFDEEHEGFLSERGHPFLIKYPKNPTNREKEKIQNKIDSIENNLYKGDEISDSMIDWDSFAGVYLIDELTNQRDSELTSMYFYQKEEDGKLFSGPVWDYDLSFGTYYVDHTISVLDHYSIEPKEYEGDYLNWYSELVKREAFQKAIHDRVVQLWPFVEDILENQLDMWASQIEKSVNMDCVRWEIPRGEVCYSSFKDNVRYLKYYLLKRVDYISNRCGVPSIDYELPTKDHSYVIQMELEGQLLDEMTVSDGTDNVCLPNLCEHSKWVNNANGMEMTIFHPIFEDMKLLCEYDWRSTEACRTINRLKQQKDLESYISVIDNQDLSYCMWIPHESTIWNNIDVQSLLKIDDVKKDREEYFCVVDNGLKMRLECFGDECVDYSTTFGKVEYCSDYESNLCYLYIQDNDFNYLDCYTEREARLDILFIVINRELGTIEDIRTFVQE